MQAFNFSDPQLIQVNGYMENTLKTSQPRHVCTENKWLVTEMLQEFSKAKCSVGNLRNVDEIKEYITGKFTELDGQKGKCQKVWFAEEW